MTTINHRDTMFLRMRELLQQFAAFNFLTERERARIRDEYLEIAPGVDHEARLIHEEGE